MVIRFRILIANLKHAFGLRNFVNRLTPKMVVDIGGLLKEGSEPVPETMELHYS